MQEQILSEGNENPFGVHMWEFCSSLEQVSAWQMKLAVLCWLVAPTLPVTSSYSLLLIPRGIASFRGQFCAMSHISKIKHTVWYRKERYELKNRIRNLLIHFNGTILSCLLWSLKKPLPWNRKSLWQCASCLMGLLVFGATSINPIHYSVIRSDEIQRALFVYLHRLI